MPQALKSYSKCNKSPNLVTLQWWTRQNVIKTFNWDKKKQKTRKYFFTFQLKMFSFASFAFEMRIWRFSSLASIQNRDDCPSHFCHNKEVCFLGTEVVYVKSAYSLKCEPNDDDSLILLSDETKNETHCNTKSVLHCHLM